MFPQLLRLATHDPQLLADHVEAYAELVAGEMHTAVAQWQRHAGQRLLVYACTLIALLLLGVAAMLYAALPAGAMRLPWALIVVPLLPLIPALWFSRSANSLTDGELFLSLRCQWAADRALLGETQSP